VRVVSQAKGYRSPVPRAFFTGRPRILSTASERSGRCISEA
jgi:hypothetical protein